MSYLDVRWSALCNLKCRMCGPYLSSAWAAESGEKSHSLSELTDVMTLLGDHLDYIEEVCFAGGEPLISGEHYQLLDYWLGKNKRDVRLRYTTNFTRLDFKDKNVLEYWDRFTDVKVSASLDDNCERGEYIRKGSSWQQLVDNRKRMMERCPQVYFEITPTMSVYNVWHFPDFHREWVEKGLLSINNVRFNFLVHPDYMQMQVLNESFKKEIRKKYMTHIDWILEKSPYNNYVVAQFKHVIDFLVSRNCQDLQPAFLSFNNKRDQLLGENLLTIFPELVRGIGE